MGHLYHGYVSHNQRVSFWGFEKKNHGDDHSEVLQLRKVFQDDRGWWGHGGFCCLVGDAMHRFLGKERKRTATEQLDRLNNGWRAFENYDLGQKTNMAIKLIWGKDDNLNHWMERCRLFCEHTHMRLSWFLSRNGISIPAKYSEKSRWRYISGGFRRHKSTGADHYPGGGNEENWRYTLQVCADLVSKMGSLV